VTRLQLALLGLPFAVDGTVLYDLGLQYSPWMFLGVSAGLLVASLFKH
jgi:hypothetical protein